MSASLLGPAAPSFDEPVEMLDACHGRIMAQIETLRHLVTYLPQHGVDGTARDALQGVLRYFSAAAPHHHEDEESDLFPALLATAQGETLTQTQALVTRLLADHRHMDQLRDALLAHLRSLLSGEAKDLPAAQVETLAELYLGHIERETVELLPLARRVLSPEQNEAIGRKMASRRGARFPE